MAKEADHIKDIFIGRRIRRRFFSYVHFDLNSDPRNTIFIAGSGRSGTTWLSDIINSRNEFRYLFEPFHRAKVKCVRHFEEKQYLRPDNPDPAYVDPVRAILAGNVPDWWANHYNTKLIARKRLIKDIRANLLLKWMHVQFPEVPIVFMLRHPFPTVTSIVKLGWDARVELDSLFRQPALLDDYVRPFEDWLGYVENDFERWMLIWCIENYVPLKQFRPGELYLMFYETLVADPLAESRRLLDHLHIPVTDALHTTINTPSATSRGSSAVVSGGDPLAAWRATISDTQAARALTIMKVFGLDRVYGDQPMPLTDAPFFDL
jgi:hypothetical protein